MYQAKPPARRRPGFTLIELLVVMAIIGVLAGMLVYAVQKARESSKRTESINNLSQTLLAMHLYHDAYGYLPSETAQQQGQQQQSFYTSLLSFVEQTNNSPQNPQPVKMFCNPSRRTPTPGGTPWRDYGYLSTQAMAGIDPSLHGVLDSQNPVTLVTITNINGTTNTAALSTLWMDPAQYNTDTFTWAQFPNSASNTQHVHDSNQQGQNGIGAPHPGANPHAFWDRSVRNIPYQWNPQVYPRMWAYDNKQPLTLP